MASLHQGNKTEKKGGWWPHTPASGSNLTTPASSSNLAAARPVETQEAVASTDEDRKDRDLEIGEASGGGEGGEGSFPRPRCCEGLPSKCDEARMVTLPDGDGR